MPSRKDDLAADPRIPRRPSWFAQTDDEGSRRGRSLEPTAAFVAATATGRPGGSKMGRILKKFMVFAVLTGVLLPGLQGECYK